MQRLHGIFTPNPVPLDARGDINEAELRRYIDWLIERGVHGIYANGSSGEFLRFSLEERRRICKIICEQCAGRVPVLAGATESNTREVIESCEIYKGYGARAVALLPPIYYKLSPQNVYAYFAEVAKHSPIDITLYNIPLFCPPIDVPTIQKLALEFPNVVGMKDSSGDVSYLARVISAVRPKRPEFTILSGWETALAPAMLLGADGGTNATSGVLPELTRRLYDLCVARRWEEAVHLQLRLIDFFDVMVFGVDFPEGLRVASALRGFDMGRSRQPMDFDRAKLENALQCVMSDFGVIDPPGTCAPRTSGYAGESVDLERDKVLEVTSAVMNELRRRGQAQGAGVSDAIGLMEIGSWAASMAATDAAEKAAPIRAIQAELNDMLGASIKFAGSAADVASALSAAEEIAKAMKASVVTAAINRPHAQSHLLWPLKEEFNPLIEQNVVHLPREHDMSENVPYAIGFIETQGFTAVIEAVDAACKAASVDIIGREKLGGGYISVVIKGDVAAVKAAVDAAKEHVDGLGKLIAAHVIARPSAAVLALLPKA